MRVIQAQEVIEELIAVAKERDAAAKRGEGISLSEAELTFYDALAANESAVWTMGDQKLRVIAAALVTKVRSCVIIDWMIRDPARAEIEVAVKRILNTFGYPPDLQDAAVPTVLMPVESLCKDWAA